MVELAINVEPQYELAICDLYHPYFHGDLDNENEQTKQLVPSETEKQM